MENNKKITVLVGISGSGKSHWAHEQWLKNPNTTIIVSRDKIRELLFGYDGSSIKEYYKRDNIFSLEKQVTRYEDTIINEALESGKHVIVDSIHLKRSYIERFKYWNVDTEIRFFNVDLKRAILRDIRRVRKVGDEMIKNQFVNFHALTHSLDTNPINFTPYQIKQNKRLKPCYIFDIDGTLAHMDGKRSPYEWGKISGDSVDHSIEIITDLINDDPTGEYSTIICTGRDGVSLYETEKWLDKNDIQYDGIYIREKGDNRPDWIVKEEMWREVSKKYYIVGMFDDRLQVVRRARALGFKVLNVEYNNS